MRSIGNLRYLKELQRTKLNSIRRDITLLLMHGQEGIKRDITGTREAVDGEATHYKVGPASKPKNCQEVSWHAR
jgi:hypothetical protein